MNKHFLSTIAIVAIVLSIANSVMLVRQNAGAARLAALSIPQLINYQGRLTDAAGNPLTGSYNMTFCLYEAATGGTSPWCETQAVNVTYGVFNVLLGSVTPIPSTAFGSINLYLGVQVGSDSEMTPRRRVVSAGYAYKAEDASTLQGLQPSAFASAGQAVPVGAIILWDGASCPPGWTPVEALVGKFPRGGTTYGVEGGSETHDHGGATASHTLTVAEIPAHNHDVSIRNQPGGELLPGPGGGNGWLGAYPSATTGGGGGHSHDIQAANHLPPYRTVLFCRKD